jgi:hypothetical protein
MQVSSSRFAPMSSARTPTRAGFKKVCVKDSLLTKAFALKEMFVLPQGFHTNITFAAPMVGASPDNIGAQRLAEGGVPASETGSACHVRGRLRHLCHSRHASKVAKMAA